MKTEKAKTLEKLLKQTKSCEEFYIFAKDLTLEEFLATCHRGDWILWLFYRMNAESLSERVRQRERRLWLIAIALATYVVAVAFAIALATYVVAAIVAAALAVAAASAVAVAYAAADAAYAAAYAAAAALAAYAAADAAAARKENQKQIANICRKYLPIEIWNQSEL